jgi:predicted transcriptional regulator
MAKRQMEITAAELSVMEVLWERPDGATVREIVLAVYGRHEHSLHGGVKSFLDRLQEKGYIKVDKSGYAHRFFSAAAREKFVGGLLKQIADSHFGGSLTPLLLTLIEQAGLSTKQRAAIEKMIENIRD